MPLDHFVSQVHLKNFYSTALGGKKMYAIQKAPWSEFICGSEDVCRILDGSTNSYLKDERAIEEFLKEIEPQYNRAVKNLRKGQPTKEDIYAVAGFAAYVSSCSPTAMRLHTPPLREGVKATALILDRQGLLPPPPPLIGKTIPEMLDAGWVTIDSKFPQAMGIDGIRGRAIQFGNFEWDVLFNEDNFSPFFTSDFPFAVEDFGDPRVLNWIVPLAPDLAIRIKPNLKLQRAKLDDSFRHFSFSFLRVRRKNVRHVNQLIVRCAERHVFFSEKLEWVPEFVQKHKDFWINVKVAKIAEGSGYLVMSRFGIERRPIEAI
jgi:hypothetical protein